MTVTKRPSNIHLSADKALGVVGGGLAAASLGFGVYMNIHGPAASFGHSRDFTVFAQLAAPRVEKNDTLLATAAPARSDSLDMTATASIPQPSHADTSPGDDASPDADATVIPSITLEAASPGTAMIVVDGHVKTIHIGDTLPDAGEVLEIRPGPRPTVKTTRGLILASGQK